MKFCEAMDLLKSGKRVTRSDWKGGLYFIMGKDNGIDSYQPMIEHYNYNETIMISEGWIVDGKEGLHRFCDIIPDLTKGAHARFEEWDKDSYICLIDGELAYHCMTKFPSHPCFADFIATDWIEV